MGDVCELWGCRFFGAFVILGERMARVKGEGGEEGVNRRMKKRVKRRMTRNKSRARRDPNERVQKASHRVFLYTSRPIEVISFGVS